MSEKLCLAPSASPTQERDARGAAQSDAGRLAGEVRKLERQRTELVAAFKKQMKLIEVRGRGGGAGPGDQPTVDRIWQHGTQSG